jgi:hypothetical protein
MRRLEHAVRCYLCQHQTWLVYDWLGQVICLMCAQHCDTIAERRAA